MPTRPLIFEDGDGTLLTDGDGAYLTFDADYYAAGDIAAAPFLTTTADGWLAALQGILPSGLAWRTDAGALWTRLLSGIADGCQRLHDRTLRLLDEADPRSTVEMLTEWETMCGLPDPCVGTPATLQERRAMVVARLTARGGQCPAYYIDLAASLGFTITIEEPQPFRCDESQCDIGRLNEDGWAYAWIVHAPAVTEIPFCCDESCTEEPLLDFGNQRLECAITRAAPAHTLVHFAYGD